MSRKYISCIILTLALWLGFTLIVQAQRSEHGHGMGLFFDKHERNLENLRLLKLLEILDLEEEQNDKFIAIFSSHRKKTKDINLKLQEEVDLLVDFIKEDRSHEDKIMMQIEKIRELKGGRVAEIERFHTRAEEILTVLQIGKMMVFEERFERRMLETVRGFRGRHAPDSDLDGRP